MWHDDRKEICIRGVVGKLNTTENLDDLRVEGNMVLYIKTDFTEMEKDGDK